MRILHVTKMTGVSGMERHLLSLLPGLRSAGLDVSLTILVEADKPLDSYLAEIRQCGVSANTLTIRRDFDPSLIGQLAQHIRSGGFDAIHTHLIHADLHGLFAAKRAGVHTLYSTAHNDDRFRRLLPIRLWQGWLWRQMKAGIAISEALRDFVIRVEFAPPQRIHTVHYGLDNVKVDPDTRVRLCGELGLDPNAFIAGSVCRLIDQKGLTYAISALQTVICQQPNVHYVIAGDGPLRSALQEQVKAAGLQEHVHFLGWRQDARTLYGAFDVFLMPSLWEGFGLVMLEAMAASCPIIASRVSALPEIVIDGETGYLIPPADPAALADRWLRLIADPARRGAMGQAGHTRLEREFTTQRMIEKTMQVYTAS